MDALAVRAFIIEEQRDDVGGFGRTDERDGARGNCWDGALRFAAAIDGFGG
jgi:hypothetical protein